jgi:hypothetical protein
MVGVGGEGASNPMRQAFGCCARAASGHTATQPRSVMNARRFTYAPEEQACATPGA